MMKISSTSRPQSLRLFPVQLLGMLVACLMLLPQTNAWAPLVPLQRSPLLPKASSSFINSRSYYSSTALSLKTSTSLEDTATESASESLESLENATERFERNQRINTLTMMNGAIIGFLAVGAAYSILHTDVEALVALWEYGLGPHAPEVTKAAVTLDVMARLPMDLVQSYEALVPTNPIFYKACTSGVAYGLGDFISQIYQGKRLDNLDMPRSFRSAAAGFIAHGPLCHFWLLTMERYLDFGGAWWATGIKVTADLTVWSLFLNAAYSFIIGTLAGKPPEQVWKDIRVTQWPALRSAWRFWPFVHTISFSHAVPLDLKLLWVDIMEVVWVTILSKVANEDKIAHLEEVKSDCDDDFGVMPELQIELEREQEQGKENLAFELPKKAWAAAWPLVAMWPVLYGGFQLEHYLGLVD